MIFHWLTKGLYISKKFMSEKVSKFSKCWDMYVIMYTVQ